LIVSDKRGGGLGTEAAKSVLANSLIKTSFKITRPVGTLLVAKSANIKHKRAMQRSAL
jgi:hypothetical protein